MRAGVKRHLCFQPADKFVLDMFIIKVISADFHHLTYQSCLSFSCLHTNELVQESREPGRTARDRRAPSEASSSVQAHISARLESACVHLGDLPVLGSSAWPSPAPCSWLEELPAWGRCSWRRYQHLPCPAAPALPAGHQPLPASWSPSALPRQRSFYPCLPKNLTQFERAEAQVGNRQLSLK